MILCDEFEPDNIVKLIRQSVPVAVTGLNRSHRSDYSFGNYDGKIFQFSRKQAGELVGNLDEAERQLADYYKNADYNFQVVEGIVSPLPLQGIQVSDHSSLRTTVRELGQKLYCYAVHPTGRIEQGHSFSTASMSMLYAWEHRLWMAGIPTIYTMNWAETARRLVIIFKNEQKSPEEHMTLNRVIRPKFSVKEPEPLMKALMFMSDAYKLGIGEKKAKALCGRYCNIIDIAMASEGEIAETEGIGSVIARRLLSALGRSM